MRKLSKQTKITLLPDFLAKDVNDIDFDSLKKFGIKAIFFDIDHTILMRKNTEIEISIERAIKNSGIKIFVATNRRSSKDVDRIAKQIGASGIMCSKGKDHFKPKKNYFIELIELSGLNAEQVAMVGDRIIQDIWGANRVGVSSVQVSKLGGRSSLDYIISLPDILIPFLFRNKYVNIK